MFKKIGIPFIALIGIALGAYMIYWSAQTPPAAPIPFQPPQSPYEHFVFGEGLIESCGEDIEISVPFPNLVTNVYVKTGESVKQATPLFKLDTRQIEADLNTALKELIIRRTEAQNATYQLSFYDSVQNKNAISQKEYTDAYFAKKVAFDNVRLAIAHINQLQTAYERSIIRAPKDGVILQNNIHAGEFANINPFDQKPLMTFGSNTFFQIRVQVAEEDAWRIQADAPAMAYVRGNKKIALPLTFNYIEPLIIPKKSLTGSDFERVDTRVLEIVYSCQPKDTSIYVGQLVDVFVKAKPHELSNV